MLKRAFTMIGASTLAALLAGCLAVTVNVTFPQDKIDSAASNIEDLVGGGKTAPADPTKKTPPAAPPGRGGAVSRAPRWVSLFGPAVAEAQVPELKTRTPEVMAAIESRRARFAELETAEAKGCVGETNRGLVEARPGAGCPANLGPLAAAENKDRMFIYQTLVQQNNMPPGDIVRVQAGFAKARREKAPAGTWIQDEAGRWTRK